MFFDPLKCACTRSASVKSKRQAMKSGRRESISFALSASSPCSVVWRFTVASENRLSST